LQLMTKTIKEVDDFLNEVHKRLKTSKDNLYIVRKKGKDKTDEFRSMYNISSDIVCEEILKNEEIYIKLKLRNNVVCMSFHPKEFDLKYPYN